MSENVHAVIAREARALGLATPLVARDADRAEGTKYVRWSYVFMSRAYEVLPYRKVPHDPTLYRPLLRLVALNLDVPAGLAPDEQTMAATAGMRIIVSFIVGFAPGTSVPRTLPPCDEPPYLAVTQENIRATLSAILQYLQGDTAQANDAVPET